MTRRLIAITAFVFLAIHTAGCPSSTTTSSPPDAVVDTPPAEVDAPLPTDTGTPDAAATDAATTDGGATEVVATDLPPTDTAGTDSTNDPDASAPDATLDAPEPDGTVDATDVGPAAPTLTVLTLNLRCLFTSGTPYATNAERFEAIAATVLAENVDVVALQEACDNGTTNAIEELRAAISAQAGVTWQSRWLFAHPAFVDTPDEADEGVGLLAPAFDGPTAELQHRGGASLGLTRVMLSDVVSPDGFGPVRVATVHFDFADEGLRLSQAREAAVSNLVETYPGVASIIAGDLNAQPTETATHGALQHAGFERSSDAVAAGEIDHIFAHRGSGLSVVEAKVLFDTSATTVSDHPGILVRYAPAPPAPVTLTRIVANHDPGFGNLLSIRGNTDPLDWDSGWPMIPKGPGAWHFVISEWDNAMVDFKALVNDTVWQQGADSTLTAGDDLDYAPTF